MLLESYVSYYWCSEIEPGSYKAKLEDLATTGSIEFSRKAI